MQHQTHSLNLPSPLQKLDLKKIFDHNIELYIKRDDLIHSEISGNKWRKLKYNLEEARKQGYNSILTYGGAWSNHLHATAFACKLLGFQSIGIIRGEKPPVLSSMLLDAINNGMKLHFISRSAYQKKEDETEIENLMKIWGKFYRIPEGGNNSYGIMGCEEIMNEIKITPTHIAVSCGTGTTISGLLRSTNSNINLIGFSALKDGSFLNKTIDLNLNDSSRHYLINSEYSFGGYGKINDELIEFIYQFYLTFQILLDPVYTGKMMFGLFDMIKKNKFKEGAKIIAIHTGGLQGIRGYPKLMHKLNSINALNKMSIIH